MKMSRCCAIALGAAAIFAGIVLWQFYAHVDQGVTLAYARSEADERLNVIHQLRILAVEELKGTKRDEVEQLLKKKGVTRFAKAEDNSWITDALIFEFDGDELIDIRSIFSEPVTPTRSTP